MRASPAQLLCPVIRKQSGYRHMYDMPTLHLSGIKPWPDEEAYHLFKTTLEGTKMQALGIRAVPIAASRAYPRRTNEQRPTHKNPAVEP
jgi:hypothetical protein